MIIYLEKSIHDTDDFKKMVAVFYSENNCYRKLAESMQECYCVLMYETVMIKSLNYYEIFNVLTQRKFFTDSEEKRLQRDSNVECIFKIVKDKDCIEVFSKLLTYLKEVESFSSIIKNVEEFKLRLQDDINSLMLNHFTEKCSVMTSVYQHPIKLSLDCEKLMNDLHDHLIELYANSSFTSTLNGFCASSVPYIKLTLLEVGKKSTFDLYRLLFQQDDKQSKRFLYSLSDIVSKGHNLILLQGSPGCGKTSLAKQLCVEWARGQLLQDYSLVFLLQLRDPRVSGATSMQEIIELYVENFEESNLIAKQIRQKRGKGIVIILEGWDELPHKKRSNSLFADLIQQGKLQNVVVIITSRPSAFESLPYASMRKIEILGFTKVQIEEYIQCYFQCHDDSVQIVKEFWCQLNQHPYLKHIACVPINLFVILCVFEQNNKRMPEKWTDLYKNFLLIQLSYYESRMLKRDRISLRSSFNEFPCKMEMWLRRLANMAYHEILHNKLTFTEGDIKKYCFCTEQVPQTFDGMGLLRVVNHAHKKLNYKTYHFIHRTIQELLAAWYLSQQNVTFQQSTLQKLFNKDESEMIWIFYAGLTQFKPVSFQDTFSSNNHHTVRVMFHTAIRLGMWFIFGKVLLRLPGTREIMAKYFSTQQYAGDMSNYISRKFQSTLIESILEVQNPELCNFISSSYIFSGETCWFTIPESSVAPQTLSALSYCIAHSKKKWMIHCKMLDADGADSLLKYLSCSQNSNCDCKKCSSCCGRTDSSIYAIDVSCSQGQITGLTKVLQVQKSLQWLILSRCSTLDDNFLYDLSRALKDNSCLKMLHLLGCKISSGGIKAIARILLVNTTLEWIGLRDNMDTLKEDDIILLLNIIHYNNTLVMLMLDNVFYTNPNIKARLKVLNAARHDDQIEPLCLRFLDCIRLHKLCQSLSSCFTSFMGEQRSNLVNYTLP